MTMFTSLLTSAFPSLGAQQTTSPQGPEASADFESTFASILGSEQWSSPCTDPSKSESPTEPQQDTSETDDTEATGEATSNTEDGELDETAGSASDSAADAEAVAAAQEVADEDASTLTMIQSAQQLAAVNAPVSDDVESVDLNLRIHSPQSQVMSSMTMAQQWQSPLLSGDAPDLWVSDITAPEAPVSQFTDTRQIDRTQAIGAALPPTVETNNSQARASMAVPDTTPKNVQQFSTDMTTHVRVLKNQGGGEARINLHPAELGRMSLSVVTEGNETKVSFFVESQMARQAVESALPRLREMLEQAGLSLTESDVSERDARQAQRDGDNDTRTAHGQPGTESEAVGNEPIAISVSLDPQRLLDTFA